MTIAILMVTAMATLFTRGFRNVILSSYFNLEKHAKEISTILKLSKTISSKEELKNILSNIADELKELLSSDFTRISIIEDDSSNGMSDIFLNDTISKKTDEQKLLTKIKMIERLLTTKKEAVVIKNPSDFEKIDDSLLLSQLKSSEMTAIMGWPIKIENEVYGTIVTGKYRKTYTDYDATLLGILSEHAAISIKNAKMLEQLHNESAYFESKITEIEKFENIIGKSPKMQSVFKIIEKAAKTDIPVIVRGESGTGKELVATALQNLSIRRDEPFIKINCAAIPKELMESELFGHEKGAFTGADIRKIGKIEQADKGTLFLDEIGDMSLGLQVKLLRVLQENTFERVGGNDPIKVDFRLISATNQNLEEQIRIGKFRKDLFYRINGLPIFLPSLHERKEDIHLLVRFLSQKYKNNRVKDIQFTNSAMKLLVEKKWEGNVRELENLIYRIITMVDQDVISADDIWRISPPEEKIQHFSSTGDIDAYIQNTIKEGCKINEEINRFEKKFLEQTLNMCGRSMVKACDLIGIKKTTLYYKVNKYNISI
ncbi:MAG: sigma 54-interacting transcriptional regulator [Proteobacteria bacterium]|nr:sigma 54-interacting transcriptional regulator [Pseudomonadota bacterium]